MSSIKRINTVSRRKVLKATKLKGLTPKQITDLLLIHTVGLGQHLYDKYKNNPRLSTYIGNEDDYQHIVYEAILKTVAIYDYHLWKNHKDLDAKARIEKWRNKKGHKFVPTRKLKFTHLGHLYAYTFTTADTNVRLVLKDLRLTPKTNGKEIYASQFKGEDNTDAHSFFDKVMGPAKSNPEKDLLDKEDSSAKAELHRNLLSKLTNKPMARSYSYHEFYDLFIIQRMSYRNIAKEFNLHPMSVYRHARMLASELEKILKPQNSGTQLY
ncbi:MAG: hypothetical protein KF802_02650 [Bdellovibrionaceae bacterium]|nr:hypothetical protein [Pseudobdellovibrionaceae bacterium]